METFANAMGLSEQELSRLRREQTEMDLPSQIDTAGKDGRVIYD